MKKKNTWTEDLKAIAWTFGFSLTIGAGLIIGSAIMKIIAVAIVKYQI